MMITKKERLTASVLKLTKATVSEQPINSIEYNDDADDFGDGRLSGKNEYTTSGTQA